MELEHALMAARPEVFPPHFQAWFSENHHVWQAFVVEARKVRAKGFDHYSARTILHVLRHHSALHEAGPGWKLNNNHSPYLARLFDLRFPSMAGMFEYRLINATPETLCHEIGATA